MAKTGPTLDGIVARFPGGPVRSVAQRLIDRARAAGATFEPGSRGFSIRGTCALCLPVHGFLGHLIGAGCPGRGGVHDQLRTGIERA